MVNMRLKKLAPDRTDNYHAWVLSQVTTSEQSRSDSTSFNPDAAAMVARMAGYVDICARRNAKKLSSNGLHLYRPARRGSGLKGKQAAYLSGKAGIVRGKFNEQISIDDDGFEMVMEHPFLETMRRPSTNVKNGTSMRFVQAYSRQVSGDSFSAYFPEEDQFVILNPAYTRIIPNEYDDLIVERYIYGRDTSAVMELSPEFMFHQMHDVDFRQPYNGRSWLHSIPATADLWYRIEDYLSQLMLNHGRPDILVHFEGAQTDEQWKQTQNSIFARVRSKMARATGLLLTNAREGKVSVNNLGHSPKDSEALAIQNEAERTICNAAGIPESIMRMNHGNRAVADAAIRDWCENTIMPSAVQEADEYTALLYRWYPDAEAQGMFFAPENCVPEDVERQERVAVQGWQAGILTRDEARALVGYDPAKPSDDFLELQPMGGDQPASDPLFSLFSPRKPDPKPSLPAPASDKPSGQPDTAENLAEGEKLNGAQIEAALLVLQRITEGTLARGAAIELLVALGIDRQRAVSMVDENRRDAEPPSEDETPVKVHDPGDESDHDKQKPCCDHTAKVWSQADAYAKTPDTLTGEGEREFAELREVYQGIVDVFDEQRKAIVKAMSEAPMGLKGANPRRYTAKQFESFFDQWGITDVEKWAAAMSAATGEAIRREFAKRAIESLQLIYDEAPDEFRAEIPDPSTIDPEEWIIQDNRAAVITRRFADRYEESMMAASRTTAERLANTLSEGLEAGESLTELQDRVQASFLEGDGVTVSEARAAKIARTEVAQAQTEGRIAGMAGSRVVKGYRFDKAVSACPICDAVEAEVGGKVFGVEEAMFPKGSSIQATDGRTYKFDYQDTIVPVHPNCRCAVRAVLIDL